MPKMKTHKGAQDRFHVTGSGKIMMAKVGKSHLRRNKPKRVRCLYDEMTQVHPSNLSRLKRALPYGAG